ncbi:hypothetical protein F2Q68_00042956 [Brassica cretica]|uniref:Uncharacterized protein n=1 Tax=Brassica cretica TaxID=69181 RepID=A0A8S9LLJ0_BRACR|nr:hypothetical protein F2Q68_00042956 [Brassica cretica]
MLDHLRRSPAAAKRRDLKTRLQTLTASRSSVAPSSHRSEKSAHSAFVVPSDTIALDPDDQLVVPASTPSSSKQSVSARRSDEPPGPLRPTATETYPDLREEGGVPPNNAKTKLT